MRDQYSIVELCAALGLSRAGYFAARRAPLRPRAQANQQLLAALRRLHEHRHTRTYGSPRMTHALRAEGWSCSRHRVARLMRAAGLQARPRRPFRPRTTQADPAAVPAPNLLKAAGPPQAPGTHLVSDITYLPTAAGWLYLAVVLDLYSRAVLGWQVAESLHAALVLGALEPALASGWVQPGALFHSDRGCQYSAAVTRARLARAGLRQSMSAAGNCYDNAFAESFFATLKADLLPHGEPFSSPRTAQRAVFDYLETFYNRRRLHSSLGYRSPHALLHAQPKPTRRKPKK